MTDVTNCYDLPRYWDLAFDEDTQLEADFLLAAAQKYGDFLTPSFYEPGCGGGRLVLELASRGYAVTAVDGSSPAIQFLQKRLSDAGHSASVCVGDIGDVFCSKPVEVAYCLVNTFRHLLTDDLAIQHLKAVAAQLIPGGLYIVGLHLFPPDADTEDCEEWAVEQDDIRVVLKLNVADCSRKSRQETLQFEMSVTDPQHGLVNKVFRSDYRMRLYQASDIRHLLSRVPEFRLVDVYDFWYDIEEPLELNNELGDTVLVLKKL